MPITRCLLLLTALSLLTSIAYGQTPTPPQADNNPQYGWLEGTITTDQGHPVVERNYSSGKQIKLVRHGGGAYAAASDPSMGGLYSIHGLKPGIYDVGITTGFWGNTGSSPYRPQRILGLLIKPGQRTLLNIVMPGGDTLQEAGEAATVSAQVTNVAAELAQQQKQIDDLKAQVAALLKVTGTAASASAPTATAKSRN